MHGADNGHNSDHNSFHGGGQGGYYHGGHAADHGAGQHGGVHGHDGILGGTHNLSIAHAGAFFGHTGSIAIEGMIFMAFVDWAVGHHNSFHYSFNNNQTVNVHYGHNYRIDGTGGGGYGLKRSDNSLRPAPLADTKIEPDSKIFIVHAHNIGVPDVQMLLDIWAPRLGLVDVTNYPNLPGVKEDKKNRCLSWDWTNPDHGPLPPGYLPGVKVNTKRFKRVFQLGKINPNLSFFRKCQLWLGVGHPAVLGELVPDVNSNVVDEVFGQEWQYEQLGTAEVKLEFRVKPSLRWYPANPTRIFRYGFGSWSRTSVKPGSAGRWNIVEEPFEANRAATLVLAKRIYQELSEFKRIPGKLEKYLELLNKLPGGYRPPTDVPDGVERGTTEDERELDEWELERERNSDRNSDSQLPTTTAPLPTTPTTPVTPAPTVDGLPPTPDSDTGSAVDGDPGYPGGTPYNPAAPAPTSASNPLPSAPGTVTAALGLPAAAPLPGTQLENELLNKPVQTVGPDGTVEVHVPLGDFPDYHGHHI
jgi:hypothetical protein